MHVGASNSLLTTSATISSLQQQSRQLSAAEPGRDVGKKIEAMFASMLIKTLRQTLDEGLFPGDTADALGGIFDQYMGDQIAQGRGLGIATMMSAYTNNSIEESQP